MPHVISLGLYLFAYFGDFEAGSPVAMTVLELTYVDQVGLSLTEICMPLVCWDQRYADLCTTMSRFSQTKTQSWERKKFGDWIKKSL